MSLPTSICNYCMFFVSRRFSQINAEKISRSPYAALLPIACFAYAKGMAFATAYLPSCYIMV